MGGDFDFHGAASGIEIEDFGLVENLMIGIAIAETGAQTRSAAGAVNEAGVVVHQSSPDQAATDLDGFAKAAQMAARQLLMPDTP